MKLEKIFAALAIAFACMVMASCGASPRETQVNNPREGIVRVFPDNNVPSFYKRCDGTTLIYWFEGDRRGGLTAVPDSPECK